MSSKIATSLAKISPIQPKALITAKLSDGFLYGLHRAIEGLGTEVSLCHLMRNGVISCYQCWPQPVECWGLSPSDVMLGSMRKCSWQLELRKNRGLQFESSKAHLSRAKIKVNEFDFEMLSSHCGYGILMVDPGRLLPGTISTPSTKFCGLCRGRQYQLVQ